MNSPKEVMQLAWKLFRKETRFSRPKLTAGRIRLLAQCLKAAWAAVKESARRAALSIADLAREEIARINKAIEHLNYRPFGMSIEADRRELEAERASYENMLAQSWAITANLPPN